MRALVTGAAGFIGSHLVAELVAAGDSVAGLDARTRVAVSWDYVAGFGPKTPLWLGDIRDPRALQRAIRESSADVVFHLAAQSHVDWSLKEPAETFAVNATGTALVAEACIEANVPLVYCSTDEVYGDLAHTHWEAAGALEDSTPMSPSSPYSAGKAAGEHAVRSLCRSMGLRAVITRGCNAWGPRQYPEKLVPILCRHVHEKRAMPVHDGGYQVRQWIHVEDFARGLRLAAHYLLDMVPRGQVHTFNLAGPTRVAVRDLVRAFYAAGACSGFTDLDGSVWKDGGARPGQDRCYHVSGERSSTVLGLRPTRSIMDPAEIAALLAAYPAEERAA